jgi:hypothetical protein
MVRVTGVTTLVSPHESLERAAAAGSSHTSAAACSRDLEVDMSRQQKAFRKRLAKGANLGLGSSILAARVMMRERRA